MFTPRIALLLLALVPATLSAQRGGGGRGGGRSGGQESKSGASSVLRLSNGDVEEMSPIKLLIDKRKDLKLSDAQVKQFKDLESEMKARNERLFKVLDSLRKDMTFSGRPDERAKIEDDRQAVLDLVGNIRLSYNETLKQATAVLDDTQKPAAAELVQKLNDAADKTVQEKLGARGGRDPG
jgi:LTXXQ motif family protein